VASDLVAVGLKFEPEAVAETLFERLKAGQAARLKFDERAAQIVDLELAVDHARAEIAKHHDTLGALCREARGASVAELPDIERLAERRDDLEKKRADLEIQLQKLAAGSELASFISEAGQVDPDGLAADLERLAEHLERLGRDKAEINQTIGSERTMLEQMDGNSRAAESGQEAEDLRTKVRLDIEQYARLRLASAVLRAGIERYRKKAQGPVLGRASSLFSALTLGSFTELRVDLDDHDDHVLKGIRGLGPDSVLGVESMSLGTADQLYLALRLATLESYLDRREPLPLIVDDILVQFDDARTRSALQVLAELSRRTQVLVFTHHEHLVRLAEAHVADDVLFTHRLPARG
jgi:uncharacterized protein YhaN